MRIPTGNFGFRTPGSRPSVIPPADALMNDGMARLGQQAQRAGTALMVADAEEKQRQEREQTALRTQRAEEAQRIAAMEAQAQTVNDLAAVTEGISKGIAEGTVDKTTAYQSWTDQVSKLTAERLQTIPDDLDRRRVKATLTEPLGRFGRAVSDAVDKRNQSDIGAGLDGYLEGMERYALTDAGYAIKAGMQAIDGMGPGAGLSPEQVQAKRQIFSERVSASVYADAMVRNMYDPAALDEVRAAIGGDSALSPQTQTQLLNRVESYIARADRAIEAEQKKLKGAEEEQNAIRASDLEIGVKRGQYGYKEIETAFNNKVISPAKRTELTTWKDNEQQKEGETARKTAEQRSRVEGALSGFGFLDFKKDADVDAVDAYFTDVLAPNLKGLPPGEQMNEVARYASKTGIVPRPVREQLRGALRAGNVDAKAQAADFLDRLTYANPAVLDDFSANDIAMGNAIASYVRAGADAKTAVDMATKAIAIPESERKVRDAKYREDKATDSNRKRLDKEFTGGWFSSNPGKVPDGLVGEYEALTHAEFLRTGDLDVAQKTAIDQVRKVWGVTSTDGNPKWMKYAPEAIYKIEGEDGKWISEQLHHEMLNAGGAGSMMAPGTTFTLAADSLTAREALPSYPILMKRDGVLEPVIGPDGRPQRFRPDYATSPAGRKRQSEAITDAFKSYEKAADRYITILNDPKATEDDRARAKSEADAHYNRLEKLRAPQ